MRLSSGVRSKTPRAAQPKLLHWLLVAFVYGLLVMLLDEFIALEHYRVAAILLGAFLIYGAMQRRGRKDHHDPS